ncbi:CGG triplet repeat-binding protein 1 [Rhizophagus clarus]|uniref:CGG triplet repeat-binding protein 1 n=1 Tax=Rhizophagus clarus TaxID=94130 RepID=A0A8H3QJE8_9GLOM|nr:CGG triplet repeat-binding protein 1 [Rhizophagus clarus]
MTFSKRIKTNKANAVTIYTRVNEYPDVFHVENGLLFCNYCDLIIYEDNQSKKNQKTLETTLFATDSKRKVIKELIKAFASTNIPIEKINHLLPFFKKYFNEGGAIPQAPILRQLYLPSVFKNHAKTLLSIINSKPVWMSLSVIPQLIHVSCPAHILNLIGREYEKESQNEMIKTIHTTLQNLQDVGVITIYIYFILIYAKEFVQDFDFFQQQNKSVFSFVEGRLQQLTSFIKSNTTAPYFSPEIENIICQHLFNPDDFYPIFYQAF